MDDRITADRTLNRCKKVLDGKLVTSMMVVATFVDPADVDCEEMILIQRDTATPVWKHIGMARMLSMDVEGIVEINADKWREVEDPDVDG